MTFAQTPIMSTYLLAFIVGEFDYVEGKSSDGVLVRVYTPLGRKEQGDFALEVRVSFIFKLIETPLRASFLPLILYCNIFV